MSDMRPILIAGPTASGKSGLALRLAEHLDGVVINADSMQVYRELRILTARPGQPTKRARRMRCTASFPGPRAIRRAAMLSMSRARSMHAQQSGRRPIIVGGTGLYLKALIEGLSPIPPVPADVRAHWRAVASEKGAAHVHGELALRDQGYGAALCRRATRSASCGRWRCWTPPACRCWNGNACRASRCSTSRRRCR